MQIKPFITSSHILSLRIDIELCDSYVPSLLSNQPAFLGQKTRERQKVSRNVGGLSATAHGVTFQKRIVFGISTARSPVYLQNCRTYRPAPVRSRLVIKTPRIQHHEVLRPSRSCSFTSDARLKRAWVWLGVYVNNKRFIFEPSRFMELGACMGLQIYFRRFLLPHLSFSRFIITLIRLLISPIVFTKVSNIFHLIDHLFKDDLYLSCILVHFSSTVTEGNHKTPCQIDRQSDLVSN